MITRWMRLDRGPRLCVVAVAIAAGGVQAAGDDGELWVSTGRELWRCRDEACDSIEWPDLGIGEECDGGGIQLLWGSGGRAAG